MTNDITIRAKSTRQPTRTRDIIVNKFLLSSVSAFWALVFATYTTDDAHQDDIPPLMTIFVQSITAFRLAMTLLCMPMQDHAYEDVDTITLVKVVRIICNWQPICEAALLPATLDLHLSQREFKLIPRK